MFARNTPFNYEKILKACAKGQKSALQTLFKHEAPLMVALSLRVLGNYNLAEQAVVSAFVLIWNNAEAYDEEMGPARGWIFSILRYRISQIFKEHYDAIQTASKSQDESVLNEVSSNLHADVREDLPVTPAFYLHLEELPEEPQKALINMYFSGMSQAQTATKVGMPLGRFKENLFLGLQHLAKHLPEFSPPHHATEKMGEYVLGGLSENEEKLVYKLMNDDAGVSRIALLWEAQFTHLLSQLPAQVASSRVWEKIKNTAFVKAPTSVAQVPDTDDEDGAEQPYAAGIKSTLRKLWFMLPFWRALALLLAIAALTFWYVGTPASDLPRKVAVLDSSMSNAQTGWVVRFNTTGDARFSPVVRQTVSDGLVLQAWKRSNGTDSALALIRDSKPFMLTAERVGPIVAGDQLLISLEPDGGSRNDRPSGTILYKGTVADL
ncbi:RNA polymerase sigma-70 factor (ECF subfamily) [Advenella incenata]|uniref:RNA polymerase sigma-70 factor (ECF subfamily) n=1 Tax=Advenella incenata TaxID=267800 RepID=A0A4Q7VUN6_9BURK|nr:RNA polymerase sigma-70 factor (ECF subfamily) [Advenella incenata]